MNLENYIRGIRKGKEINHLERAAMNDPFLSDALEGYDKTKGDHTKRIEALQKQITQQNRSRRRQLSLRNWSIAATILILLGTSAYFFLIHPTDPFRKLIAEQHQVSDTVETGTMEQLQLKEESEFVNVEPPPPLKKTELAVTSQQELADSNEYIATVSSNDKETIIAEEVEIVSPVEPIADNVSPTIPVDTSIMTLIALNEDSNTLNELVISGIERTDQRLFTKVTPTVKEEKGNFKDYIKKELRHPSDGTCKNVKGKVKLLFWVNESGRPYDVTVLESLCLSADQEAIRLIEEGPNWETNTKPIRLDIKF